VFAMIEIERYEELVPIPEERVGYLKKNLKPISRRLKLALEIDSDCVLHAQGESIDIYFGKKVLVALAFGFGMREAFGLLSDNKQLIVADIGELVPRQSIERVLGRIIGEEGKTKALIQKITHCKLDVVGQKVGIICTYEMREPLAKAISMLVNGAKQGHVYTYLERCSREQKIDQMLHPYIK